MMGEGNRPTEGIGIGRIHHARQWKIVGTVVAAIIVFVTTYALILPAITIERDVAEEEPGVELGVQAADPSTEQGQDPAGQGELAADQAAFEQLQPDAGQSDVQAIQEPTADQAGEVPATEDQAQDQGLADGQPTDQQAQDVAQVEEPAQEMSDGSNPEGVPSEFDQQTEASQVAPEQYDQQGEGTENGQPSEQQDPAADQDPTANQDPAASPDQQATQDQQTEQAADASDGSAGDPAKAGEDNAAAQAIATEGAQAPATPVYATGTLVYQGPDYTVEVTFGEAAKLPQGVILNVREIMPSPEGEYGEYETYRDQALAKVNEGKASASELAFARFFDITFTAPARAVAANAGAVDAAAGDAAAQEAPGDELVVVEPAEPVSVKITYHDALVVGVDKNLDVVHFRGSSEPTATTPELAAANPELVGGIATTIVPIDEYGNQGVASVEFKQDSFSVTGTVLTQTYLEGLIEDGDGQTYAVTVGYGPEAGIPLDASLSVREIVPGDPAWQLYYDAACAAMASDEAAELSFARFFDITILDGARNPIQPNASVQVTIELAGSTPPPPRAPRSPFSTSPRRPLSTLPRLRARLASPMARAQARIPLVGPRFPRS